MGFVFWGCWGWGGEVGGEGLEGLVEGDGEVWGLIHCRNKKINLIGIKNHIFSNRWMVDG